MVQTWDVEVVADSDSRWKWGATLAPHLSADRQVRVHANLILGRSVPSEQQMLDVGIEPASVRRASMAETVARLADSQAEVVVLACIGGCVQSLLHALARVWAGRTERPIVVTGYVGLVYEKVVDGLVHRAGADLVLANSVYDVGRFREVYAGLGASDTLVGPAALPYLGGAVYDPSAIGRDRPYTLTFVTQPGVPESKEERRYALEQVVAYARRYPDRHVVVKLRARPGERTTHVEPYHYTTLLPADRVPANVEFSYGAMAPVLDRTDLCVTVSSTAAIEAMHRRIPTGVLTDFGIRELVGNQLFLGSGAYTSWPKLLRDEVPVTDPDWATLHGVLVAPGAPAYAEVAALLADLVENRSTLPPLRPWQDVDTAPDFLPSLLARYGLDRNAVPFAVDSTGTAASPPRWLKRALRKVARRAYRYGVRVVEPRIKRLAEL
jgi:hypothetical protein